MATVSAEIRFAPKDATWVTANAAIVFANGEVIYRSTDGKYVLPDGITALSGLTWYGGVSTAPVWGAITGTLSNQTDLQNALNAKQSTITTGTTTQYFRGDLSLATFPTAVSSFTNDSGYLTASALSPYLTSATAAATYQPIGSYQPLATNLTSLSGLSYVSGSFVKMTAAGTFALDTATYLTSAAIGVTVQGYSASTTLLGNTTTGSGSSLVLGTSPTFTTDIRTPLIYGSTSASGTLTIDSTSNATKGAITFGTASSSNIFNFNVGTSSANISFQGHVGTTTTPAIYMNVTPSATNYVIKSDGTTTLFNAGTTLQFAIAGSGYMTYSGGQVKPGVNVSFADGIHLLFGSSSGSRIAYYNTSKIAFWGATPIVQPTTAYAAATFVANAGTAVNDASTFDGYTMKQVVAALRGIGLLA